MLLHLHPARSFYARLRGIWHQPLIQDDVRNHHTGLWLRPCRAVHTLLLAAPLDVVFLDRQHRIVRCVHALPPNRVAVCWHAVSVIELPGGWCQRHPDYETRLARAIAAAA